MGVLKSVGVGDIMRRGSIKDADVSRLARVFRDDTTIDRSEAELLFEINTSCPVQDPSWAGFFIEVISDYIVNQAEPEGYLTADKALWLVSRIASDGRVESKTGLDLLVNVIEGARWSPASLVTLALAQVRSTVINGDGPVRPGQIPITGTIRAGEVELVRRILCAFTGDGSIAITRPEAEILLEINDALAVAALNPAWTDLFVKAIANVLMAAAGYAVPSREEALRAEAGLDMPIGRAAEASLAATVASSLGSVRGAYHEQTAEERALLRLERQRIEIITNEAIGEGGAGWLRERLGRKGRLTTTEEALLAYLRRECPKVRPLLNDLAGRRGKAA